jgi:hypothetical protein
VLRKAYKWYGRHLDSIEGAKGVKIVEGEEYCGMKGTDRG